MLHEFNCTCTSVFEVPISDVIEFILRIAMGTRIADIPPINKLINPHRSLQKPKDQYQHEPQQVTNFSDLIHENVLPGPIFPRTERSWTRRLKKRGTLKTSNT